MGFFFTFALKKDSSNFWAVLSLNLYWKSNLRETRFCHDFGWGFQMTGVC